MNKPICSYCRSGWYPSEFHPGTCGNCGAPVLQAIEFVNEPIAFRDANPDSPYWADGGVSMRADETTFAVWK